MSILQFLKKFSISTRPKIQDAKRGVKRKLSDEESDQMCENDPDVKVFDAAPHRVEAGDNHSNDTVADCVDNALDSAINEEQIGRSDCSPKTRSNEKPYEVVEGSHRFRCKTCGDRFKSLGGHAYKHFRSHQAERTTGTEYSPKAVSKEDHHRVVDGGPCFKYRKYEHLDRHQTKTDLTCEYCEESLPNRLLLRRHMELHEDRCSFECNFCLKSFSTKLELEHQVKESLVEGRYACFQCSMVCDCTDDLTSHLRAHMFDKSFLNCTSCAVMLTSFLHSSDRFYASTVALADQDKMEHEMERPTVDRELERLQEKRDREERIKEINGVGTNDFNDTVVTVKTEISNEDDREDEGLYGFSQRSDDDNDEGTIGLDVFSLEKNEENPEINVAVPSKSVTKNVGNLLESPPVVNLTRPKNVDILPACSPKNVDIFSDSISPILSSTDPKETDIISLSAPNNVDIILKYPPILNSTHPENVETFTASPPKNTNRVDSNYHKKVDIFSRSTHIRNSAMPKNTDICAASTRKNTDISILNSTHPKNMDIFSKSTHIRNSAIPKNTDICAASTRKNTDICILNSTHPKNMDIFSRSPILNSTSPENRDIFSMSPPKNPDISILNSTHPKNSDIFPMSPPESIGIFSKFLISLNSNKKGQLCGNDKETVTDLNLNPIVEIEPSTAMRLYADCPDESYKCSLCDERFDSQKLLKIHEIEVHSNGGLNSVIDGQPPFKCTWCNELLETKDSLCEHIRLRHLKEFACLYCPRSFSHQSTLVKHTEVHKDEGSFNCKVCGKLFYVKSELEYNIKFAENKGRFTCFQCSKISESLVDLMTHLRSHAIEKSYVNCTNCTIQLKSSVAAHGSHSQTADRVQISKIDHLALIQQVDVRRKSCEKKDQRNIAAFTESQNVCNVTSRSKEEEMRSVILKSLLESHFIRKPEPSMQEITLIGEILQMGKEVVRTWFEERRRQEKQTKQNDCSATTAGDGDIACRNSSGTEDDVISVAASSEIETGNVSFSDYTLDDPRLKVDLAKITIDYLNLPEFIQTAISLMDEDDVVSDAASSDTETHNVSFSEYVKVSDDEGDVKIEQLQMCDDPKSNAYVGKFTTDDLSLPEFMQTAVPLDEEMQNASKVWCRRRKAMSSINCPVVVKSVGMRSTEALEHRAQRHGALVNHGQLNGNETLVNRDQLNVNGTIVNQGHLCGPVQLLDSAVNSIHEKEPSINLRQQQDLMVNRDQLNKPLVNCDKSNEPVIDCSQLNGPLLNLVQLNGPYILNLVQPNGPVVNFVRRFDWIAPQKPSNLDQLYGPLFSLVQQKEPMVNHGHQKEPMLSPIQQTVPMVNHVQQKKHMVNHGHQKEPMVSPIQQTVPMGNHVQQKKHMVNHGHQKEPMVSPIQQTVPMGNLVQQKESIVNPVQQKEPLVNPVQPIGSIIHVCDDSPINSASKEDHVCEMEVGKKLKHREMMKAAGPRVWHFSNEECLGKTNKKNNPVTQSWVKHYRILEGRDLLKNLQCTDCNKCFYSKGDFRKHFEYFHAWKEEDFRGERTCIDHPNENHYSVVREPKPYKCVFCDKSFRARRNACEHFDRCHSKSKKMFNCKYCGKEFRLTRDLKSHLIMHEGEKSFLCNVCGKAFLREAQLNKHKKYVHTNERPYACCECEKSFKCPKNFQRHMKCHSVNKQKFICKICDKKLGAIHNLRMHLKIHSEEKDFQCQVCYKAFRMPGNLKIHQRSHSGEKPFGCPHCPRHFSTSGTQKIHIRTHTGERPFVCNVCGKDFPQIGNLRGHMRGHTGEKPYLGSYCGKAFTLYSNMVTHCAKCKPMDSAKKITTDEEATLN